MSIPIKEQVHHALLLIIRDLDENVYEHEQQVIQGSIMRLLSALGWEIFKVKEVTREYSVDEKKVDIALRSEERSFVFIEAKAVGRIINDSVKQAFSYAADEGVPILVLTDGKEWNFYLPLTVGKRDERQLFKLDISKNSLSDSTEKFCAYLSREEVLSGRAQDKAERAIGKRKGLDESFNDQTKKKKTSTRDVRRRHVGL